MLIGGRLIAGPVVRDEGVELTEEIDNEAVILAFNGGVEILIILLNKEKKISIKGFFAGVMWSEVAEVLAKIADNFVFNMADGVVDIVIVIVKSTPTEARLAGELAHANICHVAAI